MPRSSSARKAGGRWRSGAPLRPEACGCSRWARARCAPTPSRSPQSACCSSSGTGLPETDLEVFRLDVAVAERDARRPRAVLLEIRRLEPLALLRRIDRREIVVAGRQTANPVLAGLGGAGRHDLTRRGPPQRRVGREREDG